MITAFISISVDNDFIANSGVSINGIEKNI
jgi:hypothetical protein